MTEVYPSERAGRHEDYSVADVLEPDAIVYHGRDTLRKFGPDDAQAVVNAGMFLLELPSAVLLATE